MYDTLKQAGYKAIKNIDNKEFELIDKNNKKEVWFANKHHTSYGIKYKNTHLEFARSIK